MTRCHLAHLSVIIVGKPNVGKSTLFNRIAGQRRAIVEDTPGVTRDRREENVVFLDLPLLLIDTPGLAKNNNFLKQCFQDQTLQGLEKSDLILFLTDASVPLTADDHDLACLIRTQGKPIILIGNKCDGKAGEYLYESYTLGLGDPIALSAAHGDGMVDLFQTILSYCPQNQKSSPETDKSQPQPLDLVVIGRPNVGKSTLINKLIGHDRFLTGPVAGLTRESIRVEQNYQGRTLNLIDTAGLRRKAKITNRLEKLSVHSSLKALKYAHVALLVLDATGALEKQDCLLAEYILKEGRGLILILNKWDRVQNPTQSLRSLQHKLSHILPQGDGVPIVPTCALTGTGTDAIFQHCFKVEALLNKRISTALLNTWLNQAIAQHSPPAIHGKRPKIKYMTQVSTRPPTFFLFGNSMDDLPESYISYLRNSLRNTFSLYGISLRLVLRSSKNPYHKKLKKIDNKA